jgi:hypothetical protein
MLRLLFIIQLWSVFLSELCEKYDLSGFQSRKLRNNLRPGASIKKGLAGQGEKR